MGPKKLFSRCRGPLCTVGVVVACILGAALFGVLFSMPRGSALPVEISDLSADHGSVAGGEEITIRGDGFATHGEVQAVTFGGIAGTDVSVISDNMLKVRTPANASGDVDVAIECRYQPMMCAEEEEAFTYLEAPTVCEVRPQICGWNSGATVIICGTSFHPELTRVTFNGVPADDVTVYDSCRLVATIPAELDPGPVAIAVTTDGFGSIACDGLFSVTSDGMVAGWSSQAE